MNGEITKLNVTTHSGDNDVVEVEDYSADELAVKLNDNDVHVISLGNNVYSRIDIKGVKPIVEENAVEE